MAVIKVPKKTDVMLLDGTQAMEAPLPFGATATGGDTFLAREAANILGQRNSTSPQIFRVYATHTASTNYEALEVVGDTTMRIRSNQAGAGTARALAVGTQGSAPVSFFVAGGTVFFVDTDLHIKPNADDAT